MKMSWGILKSLALALAVALGSIVSQPAHADEYVWVGGTAYLTYGGAFYCQVANIHQYNRYRWKVARVTVRATVPPRLVSTGVCRNI